MCQPVLIVSSTLTGTAVDFATDGTNVVWADESTNQVELVSSPGGARTILASNTNGGVSSPINVALAPTSGDVYWTQQGGELGHTLLSGGTPAILQQETGTISGLTADNSGAYFLISTGGSLTLFNVLAGGITFVQTSVSCACSSDVGSTSLTFSAFGDITGQQVVVETESPTFTVMNNFLTGQPQAQYFATDGTFVYWAAGTSPIHISRTPLAQPTTAQLLVSSAGQEVVGMTTVGTNLSGANGSPVHYVNIVSAVNAGGATNPSSLTNFTTGNLVVFPKYAGGEIFFFYGGGIDKVPPP